MSVLDTIAGYTRERIALQKQCVSPAIIRADAETMAKECRGYSFYGALAASGLSVIAELKAASPSKGMIAPDFAERYLEQAKSYADGGAAAISCLTEPKYFLGSNEYLRQVRKAVKLPLLRKDFVVDEYMLYEAKTLGADAILLICSLLSQAQLEEYLELTGSLGMDALVETHNDGEIEGALKAGAKIIGINNRNLQDFSVDTGNCLRLRKLVPEDIICVVESGIKAPQDTRAFKDADMDAVLVGEMLMRSKEPERLIEAMRG